jgi:ATP-binding cassette subfamily B protein
MDPHRAGPARDGTQVHERKRWPPRPGDVGYDLWQLLIEYRWRIALSVLLLVLAKVAAVYVPLVLKRIIETLSVPRPEMAVPVFLLAAYAALRFASTLFNELRDLLFARVSQFTVARYAHRTFVHLHSLGARFHAKRQIGGLLPDIDRGTSALAFLLGTGLFTLVPTLLEIALVLGIMQANYSNLYGVIILAALLGYGGFTLAMTARRTTYQRRVNKLDSNAKSRLADSLINYDTVKYFTNERLESERFANIMEDWRRATARNQRTLFFLHVGQSAIIGVAVAAIMLAAGRDVVAGRMTVGDLVLINAYVLQVCLPLNSLGFVWRETRDALTNAERLFALLRERAELTVPAEPRQVPPGPAEVRFEHVSFGYDPERLVLRDVSLVVPPGHTVAVVGGSGSGKSTLARLLLRFYDPTAGHISVAGEDTRALDPASLRAAIGVVPQDTSLFNDTIAYNIGYGRAGATREDIIEAARGAHLHDFITSLPDGYDTVVGERGVMLSGGERQRIAMARIILKNPPVLLLDEATSALDVHTEHVIQSELERLAEHRSVVVIAHRLSTVVGAHEIIVLERGRIEERGTHSQLLRQRGVYARMWRLQQRMDQEQQRHEAF